MSVLNNKKDLDRGSSIKDYPEGIKNKEQNGTTKSADLCKKQNLLLKL